MFASKDLNTTFRKARMLEVNCLAASRMRKRYLCDVLTDLVNDGSAVALFWLREVIEELEYLTANERFEPVINLDSNRITDAMIEYARALSVKEVVQFDRFGKAFAWCHFDKHPSLTFMSRNKVAWCPCCNVYYDAIKVLTTRDGLSFQDAVRRLNEG